MKVLKTISEYRAWHLQLPKKANLGLVPTMGNLHLGHQSLIEASLQNNEFTVVTLFVNQIQFNSSLDFEKYPRTLDADLELCQSLGVDVVFTPEHHELYPKGHSTYCEVQNLDNYLCGLSRPGHFQGVCTIVLKLFNITKPTTAYFGQKDFQQVRIIEQLVLDLNLEITISRELIIREASGLAMSSRNLRLTEKERENSASLFKALSKAKLAYTNNERESEKLSQIVKEHLNLTSNDKIEYITIASQQSLQPLMEKINEPVVLAIAVYYGKVRLIDNIILE